MSTLATLRKMIKSVKSQTTGLLFDINTHLHVRERKSLPLCDTNTDDAESVVVIWVKSGNAASLNE